MKHTLESFKLYYEEMEPTQVSKSTSKTTSTSSVKRKAKKVAPKVTLKNRIDNVKGLVIVQFNNIKKRLGIKSKKAKKATKAELKLARQQKIRGIIGIGILFVVVSIAYSTYMTVLFVDGLVMVFALAPQVVFATVTLLIAFYKIYK